MVMSTCAMCKTDTLLLAYGDLHAALYDSVTVTATG